jgi:hypothetical protein
VGGRRCWIKCEKQILRFAQDDNYFCHSEGVIRRICFFVFVLKEGAVGLNARSRSFASLWMTATFVILRALSEESAGCFCFEKMPCSIKCEQQILRAAQDDSKCSLDGA